MPKTRIWIACIGMALVLVAVFAATNASDRWPLSFGVVAAAAMGGAFWLISRSPKWAAFIRARPRLFIVGGVAVALLSPAIGIVAVVMSPEGAGGDTALSVGLMSAGMFVGVFLAILPRTVRDMQQAKADVATIGVRPAPVRDFSGVGEGLFALRAVVGGWPVFLQACGVWVGVLVLGSWWVIWQANHLANDRGMAALVLVAFLLIALAAIYLVPAMLIVAWCRWIIRGERPEALLTLPGRAAFGVAWRLWLTLTILGTFETYATNALQRLTGGPITGGASDAVFWGTMLLGVALASPLAVRLPALAVGDKDFGRTAAMLQGRRMWPALPVALVLAMAPFLFGGWLGGLWLAHLLGPVVPDAQKPITLFSVAPLAVLMLVFLAATAAAATVLARAYLRAKMEFPAAQNGGHPPGGLA